MTYISNELKKAKSASKINIPSGPGLEKVILDTVNEIATMVGATLGPHGKTILIERQEDGLPPYQTKDGVTVAKSLGFRDSVKQVILESFRDAAIKTVEFAGDGSSTSIVLAKEILFNMKKFLKANPQVSPQQAVREIQDFFEKVCLPYIQNSAIKVNHENYNDLLLSVAKISTNGDEILSQNVLKAFNMVGDSGHITLGEETGPEGYEVSKVNGYVVGTGFEASCGRFVNEFINDVPNSRIFLESPVFILIDGNVLDLAGIGSFFTALTQEWEQKKQQAKNVVIFAHQFSQSVLARLAQAQKNTDIKIVPCITPIDALANSRFDFLKDVAAFTGGKIFNSLTNPLSQAYPSDLGIPAQSFEMSRYKAVINGKGNEETLIERAQQLKARKDSPSTSRFEKSILEERIGRLTGGIAKLTIKSISDSQLRETKDRADDAICAIRGAAKHGVLPGGGRILLDLSLKCYMQNSLVVQNVLGPALTKPVMLLLEHSGLDELNRQDILNQLLANPKLVYNTLSKQIGDPFDLQLLDSVPAVLESLRSATGIAGLLGTLGGVCVFERDDDLERSQAVKAERLKAEYDGYSPDNSFLLEDM
jgi:chaperonin GroEL